MANRVVSTNLWNDKKWVGIQNIRTRYVWLYLLTCPQSQSCGIWKLPLNYACIDTNLDIDELKRSIRELQDMRLLIYDYGSEEIAILRYPIYNLRNINDSLIKIVAWGLKKVKNHNLIKAIYLTLVKSNLEYLQPITNLYKQYLGENTMGVAPLGENPLLKEKGIRYKGQGIRGKGKELKENVFLNELNIQENEIDDKSWGELLQEIDTKEE